MTTAGGGSSSGTTAPNDVNSDEQFRRPMWTAMLPLARLGSLLHFFFVFSAVWVSIIITIIITIIIPIIIPMFLEAELYELQHPHVFVRE